MVTGIEKIVSICYNCNYFVNFATEIFRKKGRNLVRIRVISAFLVLALLFLLMPVPTRVTAAVQTSQEMAEQVRNIYNRSLSGSGRRNFNGYCGTLVSWQLYLLGIETTMRPRNGNDHYDFYRGRYTTSGGFDVQHYPATQYTMRTALNTITKNGTEDAYNLLVGFQKTNTAAGQKYGHALVIHAILDGIVYFVECFSSTVAGVYREEGEPIVCTIEEFCRYYEHWTQFEGIAYFGVNNYAQLCRKFACHMSAMVLQDTSVYDEPCDPGVNDPDAIDEAVCGQWVEILALYETPNGSYWYEVELGGRSGYVQADKLSAEKVLTSDVTITNLRVPTNIHVGNSFIVQGVVQSPNVKLDSVGVTVDSNTEHYGGAAQNVYGAVNLSIPAIDGCLPFRNMPVDTYTLTVRATLTNYVYEDGKLFARPTTIILHQSQFQIVTTWDAYCAVKFDGNGGTVRLNQLAVAKDTPVGKLTTAVRSGYAFAGWALDPEGTQPVDENTTFTGDVTLYAQWTEGHAGEGGWHHTENGSHFCDGEDAAEGWFEYEGLSFYQYADGTLATGWAWIDGGLRYFNEAGALVTQLQGEDGRVYCLTQGEGLFGWSILSEE